MTSFVRCCSWKSLIKEAGDGWEGNIIEMVNLYLKHNTRDEHAKRDVMNDKKLMSFAIEVKMKKSIPTSEHGISLLEMFLLYIQIPFSSCISNPI